MKPQKRLKNWKLHPSMRGQFGYELYKRMAHNNNIILLTGDLGYGLFDAHREDFPERFINTGAAEQALLDIAVGLAYAGKTPVVYSITTFLIYRPFETIRTYINHENLNVKLIGGGRDRDYKHDGFSHDASDVKEFLLPLDNIKSLFPVDNNEIEGIMEAIITDNSPYFLSLRR